MTPTAALAFAAATLFAATAQAAAPVHCNMDDQTPIHRGPGPVYDGMSKVFKPSAGPQHTSWYCFFTNTQKIKQVKAELKTRKGEHTSYRLASVDFSYATEGQTQVRVEWVSDAAKPEPADALLLRYTVTFEAPQPEAAAPAKP